MPKPAVMECRSAASERFPTGVECIRPRRQTRPAWGVLPCSLGALCCVLGLLRPELGLFFRRAGWYGSADGVESLLGLPRYGRTLGIA